ncbi:hypothetical protein Prum_024570 [Phytohabitans rumicis]|uniref:DUF3558 domain-containing protein n=2 Tax=Phytohabitans rumicis TaxID=1076125 RepID=A0A6V8L830_9ACTN|nr:hypothetical protein Prum_024570 [Phytohabitans rumicis]
MRRLGAAALLLLVAGCGKEAAADTPLPPPAPETVALPAAAAGGACQLLDYDVIEQLLGTRFDVAAARRVKDTYTCVVQSGGAARPDLVLSVTTTQADADIFEDEVTPDGADELTGLGKAAYREVRAAGGGVGPSVEVAWLTDDARMIIMRYTFATGQPKSAASALGPKLVNLAKKVDKEEV